MLAARFPLSISFKHYIQLFRRGRRLIRKERDITGIIHRSDIFMRMAADTTKSNIGASFDPTIPSKRSRKLRSDAKFVV
jgi:hypothetical protein